MLTLCNFVDKHTVGALVEPTPEKLSVLIDLNRNIASGLMQIPEGAAAEQAPVSAEANDDEQPPEDFKGIDAEV